MARLSFEALGRPEATRLLVEQRLTLVNVQQQTRHMAVEMRMSETAQTRHFWRAHARMALCNKHGRMQYVQTAMRCKQKIIIPRMT